MAAFTQGHKKLGGRKKGAVNKKTKLLAPLAAQLEEANFDPLKELLMLYPELDAHSKININLKLMDYLYPKKRAIEVVEKPDAQTLAEMVEEYLEENES